MNCPECGTPLSQGDSFCTKCGATAFLSQPPNQPLAGGAAPAPPQTPALSTKRCPYCGEEIQLAAIKCRFCNSDLSGPAPLQPLSGASVVVNPPQIPATAQAMPSIVIQNVQTQQSTPRTFVPGRYKSPGVALLLSFIFPGGGQFYNGHAGKGILVLFTFWIFGITYIWSLFDAYSSAQRINRVGF